jgi:hypothetical protein
MQEMRQQCISVDPNCRLTQLSSCTFQCKPSKLQFTYDILAALTEQVASVKVSSSVPEVDNPDDILSALEFFMGTEGRAAGTVCSTCQESDLTCLSRVQDGTRSIAWHCRNCGRCCECEAQPSKYYHPPWDPACTDYRKLPSEPINRLRTPLQWEDFQHLLRKLPNQKAPGENLVPAELWKVAPEFATRILFNNINRVLEGGPLPAHWCGGIVQFLFKKQPATDISNWRPVCLLAVSYRLFTRCITLRLNNIAEAYGIFDSVQEAFRHSRNTRRQVETLLNIIRLASRKGLKLVITYLDFRNAFNSVDVEACMRILEAMNIPDVDLIRSMYQGAYYQARTSTGELTARIPLTRGTKQVFE